MLGRSLTAVARLRARVGKAKPPREELIARHVEGRSFVDVGCMWTIHGALCFAAEDAGAASVTGVDVMGTTERFLAERERRDSKVRFVQGDLHDPATIAAVGPHDVVWCSGVLYHAPASAAHARAPARADDGHAAARHRDGGRDARAGATRSSSLPAAPSIPTPSRRADRARATARGTGASRRRR